ncbi:MAG: SLC13 family permease [Pirellulaceae bacterium]
MAIPNATVQTLGAPESTALTSASHCGHGTGDDRLAAACPWPKHAAAIDLPMLLTIGAAIGVSEAINSCGAAESAARLMANAVAGQPYVGLMAIFIATVLLTEMITNVAVAAMMFYVALGLACQLDCSPRPFIMAITLAASLSFISPIGYQTNLMVIGPGGYRPPDYIRAGLPLSIAVGVIALILIPWIWPFQA